MKPGKYYVGDLCYVLHDEWEELCNLIVNGYNCLEGEFTLKDGRNFAIYNTIYGDGSYSDDRGNSYMVDSGSIGCILLSDIDQSNDKNQIRLGKIIDFPFEFDTFSENSVLEFGGITINLE